MLESYDSNSLYPSKQIDLLSTWLKLKTTYPLKKHLNESVCSLFKSGRGNELNISAFLTVKYHKPELLVFQNLPVKEKTNSPYQNNRLEEIIKMRKVIIKDILTSVDILEISKCRGIILEVFEGFFCQNLEYNP